MALSPRAYDRRTGRLGRKPDQQIQSTSTPGPGAVWLRTSGEAGPETNVKPAHPEAEAKLGLGYGVITDMSHTSQAVMADIIGGTIRGT